MSSIAAVSTRRKLMSLGVLYGGRVSGILVVLFFLPLYSRLLGPEQFGLVGVVLSLQALLLMMDLGVSVLVSRDIALNALPAEKLRHLLATAELALSLFYGVFFVAALIFGLSCGVANLSLDALLASIVLFWFLVLQNLYYSAGLALRHYVGASLNQAMGTALRAVCSALVLLYVAPTVRAFLWSQACCAVVHFVITRQGFLKLYGGVGDSIRATRAEALGFIRRGGPVALFSLAGAAVTQLDKPIISLMVSVADVAPYFIATALCMLPMSLLAGPVSQYFQPQVLRAMGGGEQAAARRIMLQFALVIMAVTVAPSMLLWLLRGEVIELWMGRNFGNELAARYVGILLPGFTVGALGFLPYSLLLAAQDFRFQALMSAALTLATLAAAVWFAGRQDVAGVCQVYAAYHAASTLLSWGRALMLPGTRSLGLLSLGVFAGALACVLAAYGMWLIAF